tara:strand:- start:4931 stop:7183 length:2253 start_codon:yes stop_codon:yes gene_type:complete
MASIQNIKKQLLPLIKGSPIIIVVFLLSVFIAKKIIQYTPTTYLSIAKIKLDNQKYGFSNSSLYKDFDVFTAEDMIQTEAEILGSDLIIKKALEKVDFSTVIKRVGSIKEALLYNNSPFKIHHEFIDDELLDQPLSLVINENSLKLTYHHSGEAILFSGGFDLPFNINGNEITITKRDSIVQLKNLELNGIYSFIIYSEEGLINKTKAQLDVKAIDKEMSILRVVFKDEVPQKSADFNNALCESYIEDYIGMKSYAANKTVEFIDLKLTEVGKDLALAESELEVYKMNNNVVNTRQETETGLRQLSGLETDLINAQINERAIIELEAYIKSGDYFVETALQVGFVDLLLTELIKKLKILSDEKQDLLIKYEEESDQVKAINYKIDEIKKYVREAIETNKREATSRRKKLEAELAIMSRKFDHIPSREKNLQVLKREFILQESVYNFLSQKRIEAFIASTSTTSFHRIIQPAYIPKLPASPNKTLITFVCGLLGLILGITFVYLRQFARAKVLDKADLERNSEIPVAGIIRNIKNKMDGEYITLSKSLLLKKTLKVNQIVVVSSSLSREGKTVSAEKLANALMALGHKVCLVDVDPINYDLTNSGALVKEFNNVTTKDYDKNGLIVTTQHNENLLEEDFSLFQLKLEELRVNFDFVILDTSPTAISINPVQLMKLADLTLYTIRVNFTPISYISNADLLAEEYQLSNIHFLLTNAHKASNYNGNLIGSRFTQKARKKGFINRIKQYINYYL